MGLGLLCALVLTAAAGAAEPTLSPATALSRAVPDKAALGEPFDVEVVLTHEKSQRYDLETPSSDGTFDVISTDRSRTDGANTATTVFHLKLAAFELGEKSTPALKFSVVDGALKGTQDVPGTKVEITRGRKGGRIAIQFYSDEDFERLYELLVRAGRS